MSRPSWLFRCVLLCAALLECGTAEDAANPGAGPRTEVQCRELIAQRLERYGFGHPLTRESWLELAYLLADQRNFRASAEIWKLIAESREGSLGPGSWKTIDAIYEMGLALSRSGQLPEAEKALREAVRRSRARAGEGGVILTHVQCLAHVQRKRGNFADLENTCRLLLSLRHGDAGSLSRAHRLLASALSAQNKYAEAEKELTAAIQHYPGWHTLKWNDARAVHLELAVAVDNLGRHNEAEAKMREILKIWDWETSHGRDIPLTLRVCHALAKSLRDQGRVDEALLYARRAVRGLRHWPESDLPGDAFRKLEIELSPANVVAEPVDGNQPPVPSAQAPNLRDQPSTR